MQCDRSTKTVEPIIVVKDMEIVVQYQQKWGIIIGELNRLLELYKLKDKDLLISSDERNELTDTADLRRINELIDEAAYKLRKMYEERLNNDFDNLLWRNGAPEREGSYIVALSDSRKRLEFCILWYNNNYGWEYKISDKGLKVVFWSTGEICNNE